MSGALRQRKIAIFLVATLAATIMLLAGPAMGKAEAKTCCTVAHAGGTMAVACHHHAVAKAGGSKAHAGHHR